MKEVNLIIKTFVLILVSQVCYAGNTCYSSIMNCGGSPSTDINAALKTAAAKDTIDGCYTAVKNLRTTCKINAPISAMYFSNGKLKGSQYFVTPKISHSGASCKVSGTTIKSGAYKTMYSVSSISGDRDSCIWHSVVRYCKDGFLGGPSNYDKPDCENVGGK